MVRRKNPLIQIRGKDLEAFRRIQHTKQNGICPLLKVEIPYDQIAVDHKHKRKFDPIGLDGGGLIRGIIQIQANVLEGKITNNFKRLGLIKYIGLPELLRNMADYLENPPIPPKYIHPDEEHKGFFLKKTSIQQVKKAFATKYCNRIIPGVLVYKQRKNKQGNLVDKKKRLTPGLEKLFYEFNIKPQFLKE